MYHHNKQVLHLDLHLYLLKPNPRFRYRALAAAQGWAESAGKPLEQLSPELFEAVKDLETRETAEEMKEMIAPLLSGEIHFRDAEDSEEREENEDE